MSFDKTPWVVVAISTHLIRRIVIIIFLIIIVGNPGIPGADIPTFGNVGARRKRRIQKDGAVFDLKMQVGLEIWSRIPYGRNLLPLFHPIPFPDEIAGIHMPIKTVEWLDKTFHIMLDYHYIQIITATGQDGNHFPGSGRKDGLSEAIPIYSPIFSKMPAIPIGKTLPLTRWS